MPGRQATLAVFPQLSNAITASGELPDDLRSAFNAAVFCAATADEVFRLLVNFTHGSNPVSTLTPVLEKLGIYKRHRHACQEAILRVNHDLTEIRKGLSALRNPQYGNAHQEALEGADQ